MTEQQAAATDASPQPDRGEELVQPVLVPPAGLVPFVLALMIVAALLALASPGSLQPIVRADLSLDHWQLDAEQVAAIAAKRAKRVQTDLPRDDAARDEGKAIVTAMRRYLADEERLGYHGARSDPEARQRLGLLEEQIRGFALRHGNAAFTALATAEAHAAGQTAARAVLAAASARRMLLEDGAVVAIAEVQALEQQVPGMTRALARTGITTQVRDGTLHEAARLAMEALIEQRWLVFGHRLPPPPPQVDSQLHWLLLAFRIEAHQGLATRRKLALVDEMSALDATYPAFYTTAVLLAREGRFRAARTLFLRAADAGQYRRRAMANAAWCRRRLQARQPSGQSTARRNAATAS